MSTITLNTLERRRQYERTRESACRLIELRSRRDDAEMAIARYVLARGFESFDEHAIEELLTSLLAYCDAYFPEVAFDDLLDKAREKFLELVDPGE